MSIGFWAEATADRREFLYHDEGESLHHDLIGQASY